MITVDVRKVISRGNFKLFDSAQIPDTDGVHHCIVHDNDDVYVEVVNGVPFRFSDSSDMEDAEEIEIADNIRWGHDVYVSDTKTIYIGRY